MTHRTVFDRINEEIEEMFRSGFAARQNEEAFDPNGSTGWRHGWKAAEKMITGTPLSEKDQAMVDQLGLAMEAVSQ